MITWRTDNEHLWCRRQRSKRLEPLFSTKSLGIEVRILMEKSRKVDTGSLDRSRDAHPTIGYLAFGISDDVGSAIWAGIAGAARQRDVNLICFVGEKLRDPNGFLAQANVLYGLVDPNRIDGLMIWTSPIGLYVDYQELVAFVEGYRPLPTVSLGMMLDGIPSIQIESYQGMREIMVHLIEVHGHRRLACEQPKNE